MDRTEILIGIAIAIIVLVVACYILSKACKLLFKILAFVFKPIRWFFGLFGKGQKDNLHSSTNAPVKRYKSLSEFADAVEAAPEEIDANLKAVFKDISDEIGNIYDDEKSELGRAILAEPVAALERIAKAPIKDKDKPIITSLFELADLIEEKRTKLDSTIRAILTEIYDYCEMYEAENDAMADVAFNLERALYPNGISESQAAASAKRQAKKEERIRAKLKSQLDSTPK